MKTVPADVQTAVDKFPLIPLLVGEATLLEENTTFVFSHGMKFPLIPLLIGEATSLLGCLD
ncbi:hypothetical protein [Nostoc sp. UCD121]|uniref:hypothetical protein n=1 Tax=Nostoc sp. UCD121 TaxID=2681305 RepID=UPI0016246AB7|nr:hypothetical protein [Nostoc sp. UCD121]MBC1224269.1 hypothetical protein [Nostoc sp. UCD120]